MSEVRVILADDHQVVRQALRSLLDAEADLRVVGEAGDGVETVAMVERLRPDVLVMDLFMPAASGLDAARQVAQISPSTRVVVLSMHGNDAYVLEAMRVGAKAYVLKTSTAAQLVHAIREVVAGRHYLSPPLSDKVVELYKARSSAVALNAREVLTPREYQVFRLAAKGLTSAQIAEVLSISRRTAESHRASIRRKLGLRSRTDLALHAIEEDLVSGSD